MLEGPVMLIVDLLVLVVFAFATFLGFGLVKKLYGGRFTNALPYLIIGAVLVFASSLIHFLEDVYPVLQESMIFAQGLEVIQMIAGVFFVISLYQIYQTRFITEGFIGGFK